MNMCYVVMRVDCSSYEGIYSWPVKVFLDKSNAEYFSNKLNLLLEELNEKYKELPWYERDKLISKNINQYDGFYSYWSADEKISWMVEEFEIE